ncbi:protein of unknown function DUF477 [Stanieria cyanosphaera PCC 7437]|uniref:TPM domain-containing protein n=1 Tax=Stanieria cyanosphaera (strain ATCC 29371 / PCC 7437) TaxID=111780 RepID=K9XVJ9_STAC7|nr:TPM domain-containing protein [Stanieria cyanosphaera]AFZ36558.1 protein of unknown function DUF477 [Stanieria cyanosphaera PCC 7437]
MKSYSNKYSHNLLSLANWIVPILSILFAIFVCATPVLATGVYDLPSPNTEDVWMVDQADEISLATQGKLSNNFQQLAKQTGQELRMVAIRRLDYGETIDTLADQLFSTWYSTSEAQANQTLLVMDTLTNNVALRTGSKAQQLVSPEIAQSVINETIGYNLRKGDKYNQALLDASDRLVALLSGKPDPGPPAITEEIQVEGTFTKAEDTDAGSATVWVVVLLLLATVIPMVTYFWYVGFPGN